MRVYQTIEDMYSETRRELKEMGLSYVSATVQDQELDVKTLELEAYSYVLDLHDINEFKWIYFLKDKGINIEWVTQEALDREQSWTMDQWQRNPGRAYKHNLPFWKQFLDFAGAFSYTYASRFQYQIEAVLEELQTHPQSRNAIIGMWDPMGDITHIGGKQRVPCSMYYQFLRRGDPERLDMHYVMRSCDFHKFFLADIYLAYRLIRYFGEVLNVPLGYLTHTIGSLHVFEGEMKDVY